MVIHITGLTSSMKTITKIKINKTGLQPVSRPVELVPLLRGLLEGQSPFGAKAEQTNRQTELVAPLEPL